MRQSAKRLALYSGPSERSARPYSAPLRNLSLALIAGLVLASCAPPDTLPTRTMPQDGPQQDSTDVWPSLVSSQTLAQITQTSGTAAAQTNAQLSDLQSLNSRVSALQARAANLGRQSVLTRAERTRLQNAIARHRQR